MKKKQLVCQYLEHVASEVFEKYQDIVKGYTRNRHGIYALYKKNKLYYVGLATNLRNRIRQHLKDRHSGKWDRFSIYLVISDSHLKELESLMLRITKPVGNKVQGKFIKAENIKRRFQKDIKKDWSQEMKYLMGEQKHCEQPALRKKTKKTNLIRNLLKSSVIRAYYKGKKHTARICKDGTVKYNGKIYSSLSYAGRAVTKRGVNGWTFWRCERSPGEWVALKKLRG